MSNGKRNWFAVFDLPVQFDVDAGELRGRYHALQLEAHPDRFASASPQERRLAAQRSALINDAYRALRDPVDRARHLLDLRDVMSDEETTCDDADFLKLQMSWRMRREDASDSGDQARLSALRDEANGELAGAMRDFGAAYDADDLDAALAGYQRMRLIARFVQGNWESGGNGPAAD